ncbi:hypothetical protein [Actinoplanes sp. NPDC049316]|uniref:hypothetical protein n=1 Tax=Actinoplanes sp. NPDC049316 TaxID=3154727 RepID=UPI00342EC716
MTEVPRTNGGPAGNRLTRIPLLVRAIIAVLLMVVGEFFATASSVAASWQYDGGIFSDHPWQLWFALFCACVVACLAVPSIAWWLLLPRVRWVGPAILLTLQAAWISFLVYQYTKPPY